MSLKIGARMKKHRIAQIVRHSGGTQKHVAQLEELSIPDCWKPAEKLIEAGDQEGGEAVLETWHLCHDLLRHVQKLVELAE